MNKLLLPIIAIIAMIGMSCNNSSSTSNNDSATTNSTNVLTIDQLLTDADSLQGTDVVIEGVCTHTCQHGATKIFLMGSDDTKIIRIEAGQLGSFDTKCVNSIVKVWGKLVEQRIDEAYLQKWESQAAEAGTSHAEAGCDTEKKARGETASTNADRIASFREKIAAKKEKTGKDYLSFYYVEATKYEIEQ